MTEAAPSCADGDTESQHSVPSVPVRFDLSKASTCCLCNEKSTNPSPLRSASDLDRWGGRRPWAKYRKVQHEDSTVKVPEGKLCLLCRNTYWALGYQHRWPSYVDYHKFIQTNQQFHQKFLSALAKWIAQHCDDPGRTKLKDVQALRDSKPVLQSRQRTALRVACPKREFVTVATWDPTVDGEFDEAKVEVLEVAGKKERGIYKKVGPKGRYEVQEYIDTGVDDVREIQSGDTPFAEEAMNNAREVVHNSWHSGKAERDNASVEAPASSGSGLNMEQVLQLIRGQHSEGLAQNSGPEIADGRTAGSGMKAEAPSAEDEEEDDEDEEDVAGALAATFSVKPVKAKTKPAPKPKPAGRAGQAAETAKASDAASAAESKAAKAAGQAKSKAKASASAAAAATAQPDQQQPQEEAVTRTPSAALAAGGADPPKQSTLVLDGRGQRLQESLQKSLGQVADGLKQLALSTDSDLDAAGAKKARQARAKQLNQFSSSLKTQLKRAQDSVNRAALQEEETQILEKQELVVACQNMCTALASASPDVDLMDAALREIDKSTVPIRFETDAWAKIHSARVGRYVLYRQYAEACQQYRESSDLVKRLLLALPATAVEDLAVLDLSTRLTCMLRAITTAEVTKEDSDSKQQVVLLCRAISSEVSSEGQNLLKRLARQAKLVSSLLDHTDLGRVRKALAELDAFVADEEAAAVSEDDKPVLHFFREHKVGVALASHARSVLSGKAHDAQVEELLLALDGMLWDTGNITDVSSKTFKGNIQPTWAKLQQARAAAASAKKVAAFKIQLEKCTTRFMETFFHKVRTDLQEGFLGFCDYVLDGYEHGGWVASLELAEQEAEEGSVCARKPLDLGKATEELYHEDTLLSSFFKELGPELPAAFKLQLEKDAFVRGHVRDLVTFVFCKSGMLPAEAVRALQREPPNTDTLSLWADGLAVAAAEILPDAEPNVQLMSQLWKAFQAPVVAELNSQALVAYREIGELAQACVSQQSNKTVAESTVKKLWLQLPCNCPLKPLWSSFFDVAQRIHELHSSRVENLAGLAAAMESFAALLSQQSAEACMVPDKLAAMQLKTPRSRPFLQTRSCARMLSCRRSRRRGLRLLVKRVWCASRRCWPYQIQSCMRRSTAQSWAQAWQHGLRRLRLAGKVQRRCKSLLEIVQVVFRRKITLYCLCV